MKYRWGIILLSAWLGWGNAALAGQAGVTEDAGQAGSAVQAKSRVVLQVSDDDPAKWSLTLNNAKNLQTALGADKVEIQVIAYGPGIQMLKFDSPMGNRIREAAAAQVKVSACEVTMRSQKLGKEDMLPGISFVPSGVTEILRLQQQGYIYIKP
jgi:intracellular sulfur oxidation DsrE/DsrF family protein